MKVLIADPISKQCRKTLLQLPGLEVVEETDISAADLQDLLADCEGLIVRSRTKVTRELIEGASRLRVIGRAGTGIDNIDIEAATRRGILVMNTPGENTISAAEHTFSLLLAMARNIPRAVRQVTDGGWKDRTLLGTEIFGKVLGIVGLGRIGREVAIRGKAFGMRVIGHDPFLTDQMAKLVQVPLMSLENLLRQSDIVTLHVPHTPKTRHLIGETELKLCKKTVRFINCARGGLIDENALLGAIEAGRVAGAALDVFESEPPGKHPLLRRPEVIATPHLGASTREAQDKVAIRIAEQIVRFLRDGAMENPVNALGLEPEMLERLRPFRWLAERLGNLHAQLAHERLQQVTVEFRGGVLDYPTQPITAALLKGYLEKFLTDPVNYVNALFLAEHKGIQLKEVKQREHEDFANLITATFHFSDRVRTISGALLGRNNPRIVRLDNYYFDAIPEGEILICSNDDRPGIIGKIGNILGTARINIANLSMGRDHTGGRAIAILNLDQEVPKKIQSELQAVEGMLWVRRAHL